jgi:AcrR family transcriptional regulator
MTETRRPYQSDIRDEQARRTRRRIVERAAALFVENGYAATTIDAVAQAAGVSRKTVFSSVGGKAMLLKYAWDWALVGDDEPVAMDRRPGVQAILAETDPARAVRLWVDMILDVGRRAGQIAEVLQAAADVDEEAADLLAESDRNRLAGTRAFVAHLAALDGLRGGLSRQRAADVCWVYMEPILYRRLVGERGWSDRAYRRWLTETVSAVLL